MKTRSTIRFLVYSVPVLLLSACASNNTEVLQSLVRGAGTVFWGEPGSDLVVGVKPILLFVQVTSAKNHHAMVPYPPRHGYIFDQTKVVLYVKNTSSRAYTICLAGGKWFWVNLDPPGYKPRATRMPWHFPAPSDVTTNLGPGGIAQIEIPTGWLLQWRFEKPGGHSFCLESSQLLPPPKSARSQISSKVRGHRPRLVRSPPIRLVVTK